MLNNLSLVGRIGRDPEIKYLESGHAKAIISLATDRPGKKDKTDWHRVELWGKAAESITEHAKKGDVVGVVGSLEYSEFEKDGQKQKIAIVNAREWRFVGGKKADAGAQDGREGGSGGRQVQDEEEISF